MPFWSKKRALLIPFHDPYDIRPFTIDTPALGEPATFVVPEYLYLRLIYLEFLYTPSAAAVSRKHFIQISRGGVRLFLCGAASIQTTVTARWSFIHESATSGGTATPPINQALLSDDMKTYPHDILTIDSQLRQAGDQFSDLIFTAEVWDIS